MKIEDLTYTDFVSLIREENRPPGGKKTIREFLINSFVNFKSKVLEVGCTNGFSTLEIARTIGCRCYGVDISLNSLYNAKKRVNKEKIKFIYGNAYNLPFKDNSFDLVVCSNATSFMEDKDKAISEYKRVVKKWGFIAVSPMYYIKSPPKKIVNEVSKIIGSKIEVKSKKEWLELFNNKGLEVYYGNDYKFNLKSEKEIKEYIKKSLNKRHLKFFPSKTINEINNRWYRTIKLFNKNLTYVGYSVILLRKREEPEEIELFDSVEVKK